MMSDVLKKLRSRSRHGRRVTRSRLFASNLKRKLKSQPNLRAFLLGKQKHSDGKKYESDKRVSDFRHWCKKVGLELHPNLYIGERDSCHKIGVVATESIMTGECLAVIPREAILSCTNSTVASVVEKEVELQQITSSWVPLLIALAAECSLKSKSHWHAYLSLVPNNEGCGPPMLWSEAEHARLLEGTCMNKLVESDLGRIEDDFRNVTLPLMKKHPKIFRAEVQNYEEYKKLVSLVMSYSFTDAEDDRVTSSTMMVPFVDLLNHSSQHHAELTFTAKALKLMVIRDIKQGEEVMNTYGELSNTSLLHTYGFCEVNNPHDIVLIPTECIHHVYMTCVSQEESGAVAKQQKHWEQIKSDGLLEENYCVDRDGEPDLDLLLLIKLLYSRNNKYKSLVKKHTCGKLVDFSTQDLIEEELAFLTRLTKYRLSLYPESIDSLLPLLSDHRVKMTEKERYGLYLSIGQQQCLKTLLVESGSGQGS